MLKRIDAHLSSLGYCSRSEAKKFIKEHNVCIDGTRVLDIKQKAKHSCISIDGEALDPQSITLLLNKPAGYTCSHSDSGRLIYSLLPQRYQNRKPKISTIGRLDAATTGAILLSDDGELNHKLTSPKHMVSKVYEVCLADELRGDEEAIFASGELMLNGEKTPLLPAKMEVLDKKRVRLNIVEGRYHQVRRMFGAMGNRVVSLHRVSFDIYNIDDLEIGKYKLITTL